ncbi:AEC family transporter [Coralliovum pocilloporae]|uniref:AEC family transporter n=1 Tax=Coralliovum pocilloporae TaxID=3066369 RepID=UPI003306DEA5
MLEVLGLALPFFGLIFLGFGAGKIVKLPLEGLAWMNVFIVYVALPALFFRLVSQTPFDQLTNWAYFGTTTFATYIAFSLSFCVALLMTRGHIGESTVQGFVGAYANVGYMGPGLTLAALGPAAAVPTALIICFDNILHFTMAPLLMSVTGESRQSIAATLLLTARRVLLHPFILATIAGGLAAYFRPDLPDALDTLITLLSNAAAPAALFALGVTVALRPLKRVPVELPIHLVMKLILHPLIVYGLLLYIGDIEPVWIYTAVLMACLPPAANVFVIAQQYGFYIERASSAILIGTVLSVFTVTGFLYLIRANILPV